MGEYVIKGRCTVDVDWSDDAETYVEVYHKDEEFTGEEYDIPVLQYGETSVDVDIDEMYIDADNEDEALEKATRILEDTSRWDVTLSIGGNDEVVSVDVNDVYCDLYVEEA